jgi:penicillin amidase
MITILVLAVAVSASGQSLHRSNVRLAPVTIQAQDDPVTTTRDAQGIWFIEGGSLYDVFEAQGHAVATDRMWQLELFLRQARGELSALLGPSQLQNDILLRTIGYSDDELTAAFNALSEDAQTAIQAYVAGINRRIFEYQSNWLLMPVEYWLLGFSSVLQGPGTPVLPTPWTVNDVIAWSAAFQRDFDGEAQGQGQLENGILAQTLAAAYGAEGLAMFADLRWINDPSALTMIPAPAKKASVAKPQVPTIDVEALPDLREAAANIRSLFDTYHRQMEELGVRADLGSYAWAVSGEKTESGNPMLYSGPQMGFMLPSIITEGSIRGGGLEVSGMHLPGVPGIAIGRTPHHAWSSQTGHAHTLDYFLEAPQSVSLHRIETIEVFGGEDMILPVYRSPHGPIIEPIPYFPDNPPEPPNPIVAWAYANWGHETKFVEALLDAARAESMAGVGAAVEKAGVSMHICYADLDGNIAYWMTGRDPIRAPGANPLLPQYGDGNHEWTGQRRPLAHDSNPAQGYYGGWNNKASVDYGNPPNSVSYYNGPAHRAQVVEDYLSAHDDLTFEEVRDLALNIATTDGFPVGSKGGGGNPWSFVTDDFRAAVTANPSEDRNAAIAMLDAWDGHFVAGGPSEWRFGAFKADAWALQDWWLREVLRITFEDEFRAAGMTWYDEEKGEPPLGLYFNVLIRALAGGTLYDWFQDKAGTGDKPVGAEAIIIRALDNVIEHQGLGPYNEPRGYIPYVHPVFGQLWETPYSVRSTYAQVVELDMNGPIRIESMFPLGESGMFWFNGTFTPDPDPNAFSMVPVFDPFMPRPFPLFD